MRALPPRNIQNTQHKVANGYTTLRPIPRRGLCSQPVPCSQPANVVCIITYARAPLGLVCSAPGCSTAWTYVHETSHNGSPLYYKAHLVSFKCTVVSIADFR